MRKTRATPIGANKFLVRIDSWQDGVIKGALDSPLLDEPVAFVGFVRLAIIIEDLLDLAADGGLLPCKDKDVGFMPTIEIEILFRQSFSWQGRLVIPEADDAIPFNSVLELITILSTLFDE